MQLAQKVVTRYAPDAIDVQALRTTINKHGRALRIVVPEALETTHILGADA
jgi:hypothetical protein